MREVRLRLIAATDESVRLQESSYRWERVEGAKENNMVGI